MARQPGVKHEAPRPGDHAGRKPLPSRGGSFPRSPLFDDRAARVASIPLVLWICAAAVTHYVGGVGSKQVAEIVHDRDVLKAAVRSVRESLRPSDTTFEVLSDDTQPMPAAKVEPPKEDGPTDGTKAEPDPDAAQTKTPAPPAPKPKQEPKPKAEPPKVAEKPKPPEPPKPTPVAPVPAAPAPPPPPPPEDHRIAVRQHAEKNQPDNPTANRIADDANHVDKETVAKNRSHDQDMKDPSFGASKGPKDDKEGSGDKEDKVADSEDKKGNDKHAPGEKNDRATAAHHEAPRPPVPPSPQPAKAPPPSVPGGKGGKGAAPAVPARPPSPGGAGPASPEVMSADKGGGYTLDPANPGGDGKSRTPGKKRPVSPFQSPVHVGSLGLGGTGLPGGPQINLDMKGVEVAVGAEQLRAERAADGAARRSAHRGKFEKNKFQKWRAAIENYEPSVELGNTTALNAARAPFATYLNTIHNRIHPIFAEEHLAALDSLPKGHALNLMTLVTHLEIVVSKDTGKIVRMGVTKASGVTAFDVAALASVDRAGPFGKAPDIIASPDGNVYLHWEFHRDPFDACTTRNARPFILKTAPKKHAAPPGPRRKPGAGPRQDERGGPGPLLPLRER